MNNSNLSLRNVIDGVTGSHNIVNMWKSEDLFNCLNKFKDVNNIYKNVEYEMDIEVSHSEIIQAIKESKSCGLDGIYMRSTLNIAVTY